MATRVVLAALLVLGLGTPALADPQTSSTCGDHIHVKGTVRTADGKPISGAAAVAAGPGSATGAAGGAMGRDQAAAFLQGLPSGCVCNIAGNWRTASDGTYDLKIEVAKNPVCLAALDRVTVDRTKLFFSHPNFAISPAP
jgi:hypothetical protein